ncbi:hypothetical protein D5S18_28325 [Nocardia panacis]|uniref:Helix-turn-helix domain-containing protein n=1 Tax=Nocardia panacis TaxID=2340916 RepID=A0A3A4KKM2_9NOCA|nr:hypothetical protein [Nocardia panacis]RJO69809.1 hypothetical protein D5S18_28325 [Nocardia panacis]
MTMPARYKAEQPFTYTRVEAGELPAEVLTPHDRRVLVRQLVADGFTDLEIASRTQWTLFTAARIRDSIFLRPNHPTESEYAV